MKAWIVAISVSCLTLLVIIAYIVYRRYGRKTNRGSSNPTIATIGHPYNVNVQTYQSSVKVPYEETGMDRRTNPDTWFTTNSQKQKITGIKRIRHRRQRPNDNGSSRFLDVETVSTLRPVKSKA
jgi:hypothetical protein